LWAIDNNNVEKLDIKREKNPWLPISSMKSKINWKSNIEPLSRYSIFESSRKNELFKRDNEEKNFKINPPNSYLFLQDLKLRKIEKEYRIEDEDNDSKEFQ
jgi:hypothetical protein